MPGCTQPVLDGRVVAAWEPLTAPGVCPVLVGVTTVVVPVPAVVGAVMVVEPLVVPPPAVEVCASVPDPEVAAPLVPELPGEVPEEVPGEVPAPGFVGPPPALGLAGWVPLDPGLPGLVGEPELPGMFEFGLTRSASSSSGMTISREGAHQAQELDGMISEKFLRDLALSASDEEMTR